jgi:transposase
MCHTEPSGPLPQAPCRERDHTRRWPQKTERPETALPRLSPSTIMSPAPRPSTKLRLDPRAATPAPRPASRDPPLDATHPIQLRGAETGPSPVDRGRAGSKHHLLVDATGIPLAFSVTGGNRNDVTQLIPLLDAVPRVHGRRGRPRQRPERVVADRGYDHDKHRRLVRERGITPLIARRQTTHGSGLGSLRWVVERTFAWLHHFKRLLIRYDRRHEIHHAFLAIGCCLVCYRRLNNSF